MYGRIYVYTRVRTHIRAYPPTPERGAKACEAVAPLCGLPHGLDPADEDPPSPPGGICPTSSEQVISLDTSFKSDLWDSSWPVCTVSWPLCTVS